MKTVQMTVEEDLLKAVDRVARRLRTSRSALTRQALREMIKRGNISRLERQHRRGYELHPVAKDEFSVWEDAQVWGGQ